MGTNLTFSSGTGTSLTLSGALTSASATHPTLIFSSGTGTSLALSNTLGFSSATGTSLSLATLTSSNLTFASGTGTSLTITGAFSCGSFSQSAASLNTLAFTSGTGTSLTLSSTLTLNGNLNMSSSATATMGNLVTNGTLTQIAKSANKYVEVKTDVSNQCILNFHSNESTVNSYDAQIACYNAGTGDGTASLNYGGSNHRFAGDVTINTGNLILTQGNLSQSTSATATLGVLTTLAPRTYLCKQATGRFLEVAADVADSCYLDFHSKDSNAATVDYDARILATGGNAGSSGGASMSYYAYAHHLYCQNTSISRNGTNKFFEFNTTTSNQCTLNFHSNESTLNVYDGQIVCNNAGSGNGTANVTYNAANHYFNGAVIGNNDVTASGSLYCDTISTRVNQWINHSPIYIAGGYGSDTTGGSRYYYLTAGGLNNTTNNVSLNWSIRAQHDIWCSGGNVYVTSDQRTKTNVKTMQDCQSLLQKIGQPVQFMYIESGRQSYGFIAQEVEPHLPFAVSKSSNFIPSICKHCPCKYDPTTDQLEINVEYEGPLIRLVDSKDKALEVECTKSPDNTILIPNWSTHTPTHEFDDHEIFLFGTKVDDLRVLSYDGVFSIGIVAIQELIQENQELKSRVTNLEERLARLEDLIGQKH